MATTGFDNCSPYGMVCSKCNDFPPPRCPWTSLHRHYDLPISIGIVKASLCGPHCGRPCAMTSMVTAASIPNSARSTFSAWLRCRRAALSPACSTSWRHVSRSERRL
jgi:hypothetical protein